MPAFHKNSFFAIKSVKKLTAPKNAVITPKGISPGRRARAKLSLTKTNIPPKIIEIGREYFVFWPVITREILGIINPTHPIIPDNEIIEVVSRTEINRTNTNSNSFFIPMENKTSLSKENTFNRHR